MKDSFFTIDKELFESSLSVVIDKIKRNYIATVYTSAGELLNKIKAYTPIGNPNLWHPPYWPKNYVPGTLRASWEMTLDQGAVTIKNSQPYAYQVEFGWSKQAPEGMLRRACLEYPDMFKHAVKR